MIALVGQRGGSGGLIAVNPAGRESTMPFNARGMYRGVIDATGRVQTTIYREPLATVRELAA